MIEILVIYIVATLLCTAVYIEWSRRKLSKIVKHLPGPPEIPVLGSLYALQPKTNNGILTLAYALFFLEKLLIYFSFRNECPFSSNLQGTN